jgi:hypothetical protein
MGGLVTICLMGIIGTVSFSPQAAGASWTDSGYAKATYGALVVNPPTLLHCSSGLLKPVKFTWTPPLVPTVLNLGVAITGYRWRLLSGASVVATGALGSTATSVSLSVGLVTLGTYDFSLVATGPGAWESEPPLMGTASFLTSVLTDCSPP